MSHYKLKQPVKRPLDERLPFYFFAGFLSLFLVWIMLIRPLSLPADKMPFIFAYDAKTHKVIDPHKQKLEYALYTGLPMLLAPILLIPVIRNGNKHDYALALLWANRNNIMHEDFGQLCDLLKPNMIKDNGSTALIAELQSRVDKYKGKDMRVKQYKMKAQYAENLELVN